jgi:hypothetical protein
MSATDLSDMMERGGRRFRRRLGVQRIGLVLAVATTGALVVMIAGMLAAAAGG